jgi:hypothetical protein
MTSAYVPDSFVQQPALQSHDRLLALISAIKARKNVSRAHTIHSFFNTGTITTDQSQAFSIGASLLLMISCSTSHELGTGQEEDIPPILWRDDVHLEGFMSEMFPRKVHPYFDLKPGQLKARNAKKSLTALQMKKTAGLRLQATTDLRRHLTMDLRRGVIRVFDGTAVLKEILMATLTEPEACILPRSLVLEVLDTIHNVLFPPDQRSQALLSSLVRKQVFDEDILRYVSAPYRRKDDPTVDYSYFGTRLAEIYEEMQNPTPRRGWESWFERKSGARYMLAATMVGVFIAVIIGILGLGISGFQAYVSYQQWKHPVKDA